jgi:hypothetical protein
MTCASAMLPFYECRPKGLFAPVQPLRLGLIRIYQMVRYDTENNLVPATATAARRRTPSFANSALM